MKVIDHIATAQNVTSLPPEVLNLIITYVGFHRSTQMSQKDLWACSLVCTDWYASTIKHLYKAPALASRNFSEFARTLSPPIAARARRIGLEDLVQYLDMGSLAYESKKSTTSRLLSRTKNSLLSFVAPAVSFSTTSLAPLSKCSKLQHLDLSRDVYDFDLWRLLRSTRSLLSLSWLSLPKESEPFICLLKDRSIIDAGADFWPPNLTYLQLNEAHMTPSNHGWTLFVKSLPSKLDSLHFRNSTLYDPFDNIANAEGQVPQVKTLSIGVGRSDDTYFFNHFFQPFPNTTKAIIPAMTSWHVKNFLFTSYGSSWSLSASEQMQIKPPQNLEMLILEESPDFPASSHIRVSSLQQFVEYCPRLMRIDVPEAYLDVDEDEDLGLDELNKTLGKRALDLQGGEQGITVTAAGIFMTEGVKSAGVGMKRSFRYRGDG